MLFSSIAVLEQSRSLVQGRKDCSVWSDKDGKRTGTNSFICY